MTTHPGSTHKLACLILLACAGLAACVPPSPKTTVLAPAVETIPSPTASPAPAAETKTIVTDSTPSDSRPTSSSTATATPTTTPQFNLCSPLEGIALDELGQPDLLKTAFEAPRPGQDDGHHGADFAYWSRGTRKAMLGLPVYSVLSGRVAGLVENRPPYGNAILIETPLEAFPPAVLAQLRAPTPAPTIQSVSSLSCPTPNQTFPVSGKWSIYLLYAHLNTTPALSIGQAVTCGQAVGEVGTTGNSVNPHLHLETRIGPAHAVFPAMAHYTTTATDEEMANYCAWRVGGQFQMFDPMQLLALQP